MGICKVKPDADPAMIKSAQDKVARFTETVPGCQQALVTPLHVQEMADADKDTFGNEGRLRGDGPGLQLYPQHGVRE